MEESINRIPTRLLHSFGLNTCYRQATHALMTLPADILYIILANATLPERIEVHGAGYERQFGIEPSTYLKRKIGLICNKFEIPRSLILDVHFTQNQPWACIRCLEVDSGRVRIVRFGDAVPIRVRAGVVSEGTFEEHPIFTDNVKHLGLMTTMDTVLCTDDYVRVAEKMCATIRFCKALASVTFYQDKLMRDGAAYFCNGLRRFVGDMEAARYGLGRQGSGEASTSAVGVLAGSGAAEITPTGQEGSSGRKIAFRVVGQLATSVAQTKTWII